MTNLVMQLRAELSPLSCEPAQDSGVYVACERGRCACVEQQRRQAADEIERLTRERDQWQARAMALFYGGDLDKVTCAEIRKAADGYNAWLASKRSAVEPEKP